MNVRRALSRVRGWMRAQRPQALILLYHRVAEVDADPWDLAVQPSHFAEHLEVIGRHGRPMSLQALRLGLAKGRIPRGAVVVTFDDGYADNLLNAEPLLRRFGVPATVFLTAGKLGGVDAFWWDELTDVFLRPGTLPDVLELELAGGTRRWEFGSVREYGEAEARKERRWRGWYERMPSERHRALADLFALLQPLSEDDRNEAMARIRAWAGTKGTPRPESRTLTRDEAAKLARSELVDIGSHTVTHSRLSTLPPSAQKTEIGESRRILGEIVGEPVTTFAYPFGQPGDYDAVSVELVRETGFTAACSNRPGAVRAGAEPFDLPRHYVSDWNGEEFAREWTKWQQA